LILGLLEESTACAEEADETWAGQQGLEREAGLGTECGDESEKSSPDSERPLGSIAMSPGLLEVADAASVLVTPLPLAQDIEFQPGDGPETPMPAMPGSRPVAVDLPSYGAASDGASVPYAASTSESAETGLAPAPAVGHEQLQGWTAANSSERPAAKDVAVFEAPNAGESRSDQVPPSDPPMGGRARESSGPSAPVVQEQVPRSGTAEAAPGFEVRPEKPRPGNLVEPAMHAVDALKLFRRAGDGPPPAGNPDAPAASPQEQPAVDRPVVMPKGIQASSASPADVLPVEPTGDSRRGETQSRPEQDVVWMQMPDVRLPGANAVDAVAQSNGHLPPDDVIGSKLIHQIVQGAKVHLFEGGGSMTLRLEPPHLGMLHMSVTAQQGIVVASIQTSTEAARQVLAADLPSLAQALVDAGVKVDSINVSVGGSADQGWTPQSDAHGGRPDAGSHGDSRFVREVLGPAFDSGLVESRRLEITGRLDYLA